MSEFLCPSCKHLGSIFPVTTGGAASLCDNPDDLLARIPLDPRLTRALDEGKCPFELARFNSMYNDEGLFSICLFNDSKFELIFM